MSQTMKIRKGDTVRMISGKDRGKEGRVIDAQPGKRRVIVENLNQMKRHQKPRPMRDSTRMGGTQVIPGGILEKAAAVDVSNVMLVCPVCKQPTRIGYKVREEHGTPIKVRVCRNADCGQEVDR